jgi:uncharacterized phage protein gp47/JayE
LGIAPIGHTVTVAGCESFTINISANFTFQIGWDWDSLKPYAEQTVDSYFLDLSKSWDSSENIIVRVSQVESRFLALTGVLDVSNVKLNNNTNNLVLTAIQIPIRGEISATTT